MENKKQNRLVKKKNLKKMENKGKKNPKKYKKKQKKNNKKRITLKIKNYKNLKKKKMGNKFQMEKYPYTMENLFYNTLSDSYQKKIQVKLKFKMCISNMYMKMGYKDSQQMKNSKN